MTKRYKMSPVTFRIAGQVDSVFGVKVEPKVM